VLRRAASTWSCRRDSGHAGIAVPKPARRCIGSGGDCLGLPKPGYKLDNGLFFEEVLCQFVLRVSVQRQLLILWVVVVLMARPPAD